ncbi:MAG: septal ring lytic transglycosylase RlpA family protein [Spirochaetaceae bacterium]|nr:MAG: septal ring lytic transglycosylase RlpA family protein [Spirochaetaceae bacterium]
MLVVCVLAFGVSIGGLSAQDRGAAGSTAGSSANFHSLPLPQLRGEAASRAQRAASEATEALEASRNSETPVPRLPLPSAPAPSASSPHESESTPTTVADKEDSTEDGATTSRSAAAATTSTPVARDEELGIELEGIASWYGGKFQGRQTANGEIFDTNQLTAAHRTLPFGTLVRVHNPQNSTSVVVRINDRGPFVDNRIIDLSRAGADAIGMTAHGIAPVRLEIMYVPNDHLFHTVQVASFGSRNSANTLRDRLREAGIEAAIESPAEPAVHRVVIQGVLLDDIDSLRADLSRLGYANVLVRRR